MDISIVIPCYNHGHFIQDAINSVECLTGVDYEIIIVNDGSTDAFTVQKLNELNQKGYNIISHSNKGLAYSRNIGIQSSRGKYILPLDADNKIDPAYIYKAIKILEEGLADIVYAKPIFFGELDIIRCFETKSFNQSELFHSNFIDACAIFLKSVWQSVGGYDEKMPIQGHEDWEFWIHAAIKGVKFHFIDEELYFYRIVKGSMIEISLPINSKKINHIYIINKHYDAFLAVFRDCIVDSQIFKKDQNKPFRSMIKYFYNWVLPNSYKYLR